MQIHMLSRLVRPVALFILIAGTLLLGLNNRAWATPAQGVAGQTVPTITPGSFPEPSSTPTNTPTIPPGQHQVDPTGTPTIPPGERHAEPTSTPGRWPSPSSIPPATPTVVPIVAVPSTLPNTGAPPAPVSSRWIWALIILSLAAGVALRLRVRWLNRE